MSIGKGLLIPISNRKYDQRDAFAAQSICARMGKSTDMTAEELGPGPTREQRIERNLLPAIQQDTAPSESHDILSAR